MEKNKSQAKLLQDTLQREVKKALPKRPNKHKKVN